MKYKSSLINQAQAIAIALTSAFSIFSSSSVIAQTDEAKLRADLEASLEELAIVREKISSEKPELGKQLTDLEGQLLELRKKRRIAMMTAESRESAMRDLKANNEKYSKDADFIADKLNQYALGVETHLRPGEKASFGEELNALRNQSELTEKVAQLGKGVDRLEALLGGQTLEGELISPDGTLISGTYAHLGPLSWFLSDNGDIQGSVTEGALGAPGKIIAAEKKAPVAGLFKGEELDLAIDVTGGKALAISRIQEESGQLLKKGGAWLWPILGVALISIICAILKAFQLIRIRAPKAGWVADILGHVRAGEVDQAKQLAGEVSHPSGNVLREALDYTHAGADVVEEVVYEQLITVQERLQRWLPFIAITAATAPLLGLLGTVSGMIKMFNVITVTGSGDVKPLAGGISEALVTTLFGLAVAIPALILHSMLQRRSQGVVQLTEKLGLTLVNGLRKSSTQKSA